MTVISVDAVKRMIELTVDGQEVRVTDGSTILDACRRVGIDTPTLCYGDTLTPVNVCRVCVVEVEGARALVPACSRKVEPGMVVHTDSPRVQTSRRLVLELLGSSVDLSTAPDAQRYIAEYEAEPDRFGADSLTVAQAVKVDNELYVRDYAKCILCYKCVEACGDDHQNTFAIAVAGRGFAAHISTELDVALPESACVYCGNCIAVCPTGALMPVERVRDAARRHLGRVAADAGRHDLPVLRRRLQPDAPRARRRHRQGQLARRPRRHEGQPLHQGAVRLPARAEQSVMARFQILYWQDVPSLVKAFADDGTPVSRELDQWFQQEIDRRAMAQGLLESGAYLEAWNWGEPEERAGEVDEVLDAVEQELEAQHRRSA